MRRSGSARIWLLSATLLSGAGPAAAEVLLTFGIEQRFESGRNVDLSLPEGGNRTASVTRLSFGAISRTPIDRLEFNASGALDVENDADADGTTTDFGRPDLGLRYTREVPNALFTIGAQYRSDDLDTFDDFLTDSDLGGRRTDASADLRFETGRTAPVGFAIFGSFLRTTYEDNSDPDLVDTDLAQVGVETQLRFSEILEGRVGLGHERETRDDVTDEVIETDTALVGLTYLLPNGTATADLTLLSSDEEGDRTSFVVGRTLVLPAATIAARLGLTDGDIGGTDLIGSLAWTQTLPRSVIALLLERRISFDEDTIEAVTTTVFSLGLTHEINDLSSFGLFLSQEVADSPSERFELSQVSATYLYRLSEDWGLESGVRYRVRRDEDGRSHSPDIFLALSRSFEMRP